MIRTFRLCRLQNAATAEAAEPCRPSHGAKPLAPVRIAGVLMQFSAVVLGLTMLMWPTRATAQISERYLLTFQSCASGGSCPPANQTIYLAQSNDGSNWSLVPGFTPQNASVPTPIRRGNTLYVYFVNPTGTTVSVMKYHFLTGVWDSPIQISLSDTQGYGGLVDPSAILDSHGNIVLFYTSAPVGANYDPSGCPPGQATCVQHFRMATENASSDGTAFTAAAADVVSVPMGGANQPTNSGDSFVFFDGVQYDLYLPSSTVSGQGINAILSLYTAASLGGSYALSTALPNGVLIPNPGGIGSGYFNAQLGQYWTYVSTATSLLLAVTTSLNQQLTTSDFTSIATGSSLGIGSSASVQHPHIISVMGSNPKLTSTHDFNNDARSDIFWRDTSGNMAIWEMNGTAILNQNTAGLGGVPTIWSIVGQRDFNGDGKADILWRDTSGDLAIWEMSGTTILNANTAGLGNVPTARSIVGTGDFNGDGYADILWRNTTTGDLAIWEMNGTTILNANTAGIGNVPTNWSVVGVGDFNGDGKADILWRNTNNGNVAIWLMNGTTLTNSSTATFGTLPLTWSVAGTGDFNGDGKSDILLRDTSGNLAIWEMNGTTILNANTAGLGNLSTVWGVAATGDFDGDGKSDILWRDTSGDLAIWFMNGTTVTSGPGLGTIPTTFTIQDTNAD